MDKIRYLDATFLISVCIIILSGFLVLVNSYASYYIADQEKVIEYLLNDQKGKEILATNKFLMTMEIKRDETVDIKMFQSMLKQSDEKFFENFLNNSKNEYVLKDDILNMFEKEPLYSIKLDDIGKKLNVKSKFIISLVSWLRLVDARLLQNLINVRNTLKSSFSSLKPNYRILIIMNEDKMYLYTLVPVNDKFKSTSISTTGKIDVKRVLTPCHLLKIFLTPALHTPIPDLQVNENNMEFYGSQKIEGKICLPIYDFSKLFNDKDENIKEVSVYDMEPNEKKKKFIEEAKLCIHKTLEPLVPTLVKISQNLNALIDSAISCANLKIVEANDFAKKFKYGRVPDDFEGLVFWAFKNIQLREQEMVDNLREKFINLLSDVVKAHINEQENIGEYTSFKNAICSFFEKFYQLYDEIEKNIFNKNKKYLDKLKGNILCIPNHDVDRYWDAFPNIFERHIKYQIAKTENIKQKWKLFIEEIKVNLDPFENEAIQCACKTIKNFFK